MAKKELGRNNNLCFLSFLFLWVLKFFSVCFWFSYFQLLALNLIELWDFAT
jgi:hypothetical protein